MTPAVAGLRRMPRRTIDNRIPANTNHVGPVEPGDIDLFADMPQPSALVQPGIAVVMDGMAIMPAGFRHQDWFSVAAPGRH